MTVLLCNDDGVQSQGMHSLREGLIAAGHRVFAVAPSVPRSGTSRSASFRPPVNLWQVAGDDINPVYACDGTPVDCVRLALLTDLGDDVDLVVSGINEGANLGDDSTYSSTVGAAVEGALLGLPAFAISQQARDGSFRLVDRVGYDWDLAVRTGVALVEQILDQPIPERTVINVNTPGLPQDRLGVEITIPGRRAWRRSSLVSESTAAGTGYFTFDVNADGDAPYHREPGTDFDALRRGHISVSALSVNWADPLAATDLREWLEQRTPSLLHHVQHARPIPPTPATVRERTP